MDRFEGMGRAALVDELRKLDALINTPELLDFWKGAHLEFIHQEQRFGTTDREGKTPYDWHWLVAHLAGRALEHNKEAERLQAIVDALPEHGVDVRQAFEGLIAHHREKAIHHTITTAAALGHWHARVLGKATTMRAGHAASIAAVGEMAVWG